MRKLLFGLFALGLANICNAQTADKKKEQKPASPEIQKVEVVKFTPPRVIKKEQVKSNPASPKIEVVKFRAPRKTTKKIKNSQEPKFVPPVVVQDKTTN